MTEKRFRITTNPKKQSVAFDEKQKKHYIGVDLEDLLNEQQARIKELEEENDILEQKLQTRYIVNKQYEEKERLKKENEQLRRELDGFHPVMFQDMRRGTVVLYLKELE